LATALARDTGARLLIVHVEEPPMATVKHPKHKTSDGD